MTTLVAEATHKPGVYLRAYALAGEGPKRWGPIEEADVFAYESTLHATAKRKGLEPSQYRVIPHPRPARR